MGGRNSQSQVHHILHVIRKTSPAPQSLGCETKRGLLMLVKYAHQWHRCGGSLDISHGGSPLNCKAALSRSQCFTAFPGFPLAFHANAICQEPLSGAWCLGIVGDPVGRVPQKDCLMLIRAKRKSFPFLISLHPGFRNGPGGKKGGFRERGNKSF